MLSKLPNYYYENMLKGAGYRFVAGVDEAGRGSLAGDVFAAAVILPPDFKPPVNDSKKLSSDNREKLFFEIINSAESYAIASASADEINSTDILAASQLAMNRAVAALDIFIDGADIAIVDGNQGKHLVFTHYLLIKGDSLSKSVAAASILAKVSRDRYMKMLAAQYPGYGFERNMGYGTFEHREALLKLGQTKEHRTKFLRKILRFDDQLHITLHDTGSSSNLDSV